MRSLHSKLSWLKCSLNVIGQLCCFEEINSIPAEKKQSVLALKCLGTNVVGTKVYKTAFSGILSSGGLLHSDWLQPKRVIAHYHKVDLISTLLDALTVQNAPRRSRRSSPPAHIENEWLPATLTLSPPAVWTHSKTRWDVDELKLIFDDKNYDELTRRDGTKMLFEDYRTFKIHLIG